MHCTTWRDVKPRFWREPVIVFIYFSIRYKIHIGYVFFVLTSSQVYETNQTRDRQNGILQFAVWSDQRTFPVVLVALKSKPRCKTYHGRFGMSPNSDCVVSLSWYWDWVYGWDGDPLTNSSGTKEELVRLKIGYESAIPPGFFRSHAHAFSMVTLSITGIVILLRKRCARE